MITQRQEKILNHVIEKYLNTAEPISSTFLKETCNLDISPATIRNDLQDLMEKGYISQPHISAGRIPTNKAYKYFVSKLFEEKETDFPDFIVKEIEEAKDKIEKELKSARELIVSLTQISITLDITHFQEDKAIEILSLLGPSKTTYDKNIHLIDELKRQLRNF